MRKGKAITLFGLSSAMVGLGIYRAITADNTFEDVMMGFDFTVGGLGYVAATYNIFRL